MKQRLYYLLMVGLILTRSVVIAQSLTPTSIPAPTGVNTNEMFSPSITAFSSNNSEKVITAYTVLYKRGSETTPHHRGISISRASGGGAYSVVLNSTNYPNQRLADPLFHGISSDPLENMDDAQIIAVEGNKLVCVVRAWGDALQLGAAWKEQSGAIFVKSGIYLCYSTDEGANWGYDFNNGSGFQRNKWYELATTNVPTLSAAEILENPRIAYRREFDNKGYVVWGKKVYSSTFDGTNWIYNLTTSNPSSIGINSFSAATCQVLPTQIKYLSVSTKSTSPGPERPSIAVAPDGILIGYYAADYSNNLADYEMIKGVCGKINGTYEFTFSTTKKTISNVLLPGAYDQTRGALYATDFTDQVDLAQGPSIQTAVESPQNCCEYHVGFAYSYPGGSSPTDRWRVVKFWSCKMLCGQTLSDVQWDWNRPQDTPNDAMCILPVVKYAYATEPIYYRKVLEDVPLPPSSPSSDYSASSSYFVLSYIYAERTSTMSNTQLSNAYCKTAISFLNDSWYAGSGSASDRFVRDAENSNGTNGNITPINWGTKIDVCPGYNGDGLGNLTAHTIWHNIKVGAGNTEAILTNTAGGIIVKPSLAYYPANNPEGFPKGGYLAINNSGNYIWGPYYYFNFNDIGRPQSIQAQSTITPGNAGPHEFKEFVPPLTTPSVQNGLIHAHFKGTNSVQGGLLSYSCQRKVVTTGGVGHIVFERKDLNPPRVYYSMTGRRVAHSDVVNLIPGKGINHKAPWINRIPSDDLTSNSSWDHGWTQPIELGTPGVEQLNPSISVYENGAGGNWAKHQWPADHIGFNGTTAIAVTWTEKQAVTGGQLVSIKFKTREFNVCTGQWANWSPTYTIHSHLYPSTVPPLTYLYEDVTRPVICPLVAPTINFIEDALSDDAVASFAGQSFIQGTAPTDGLPTYLLGWNITWPGPELTQLRTSVADYDCLPSYYAASTIPIIQSGLYARNWLRANSSNALWGKYPVSPILKPSSSTEKVFNLLPSNDTKNPVYVSLTHSENKFNFRGDQQLGYACGIAYTEFGNTSGLFHLNALYNRTTSIGDLEIATKPIQLGQGNLTNRRDRNPSISINSSGQYFIAFESMHDETLSNGTTIGRSEIIVQGRPLIISTKSRPLFPRVVNSMSKPKGNNNWSFLLNPSITGTPKSRSTNILSPGRDKNVIRNTTPNDEDLGGLELSWWLHSNGSLQNHEIFFAKYYEAPYAEGVPDPNTTYGPLGGNFDPTLTSNLIPYDFLGQHWNTGIWPQRSFSQRQKSPNSQDKRTADFMGDYTIEGPFVTMDMKNAFASQTGSDWFPIYFQNGSGVSYKTSLYDTSLSMEVYRGEVHSIDSSWFRFTWGGIHVLDTNLDAMLGATAHKVTLHCGIDTAEYMSQKAARDSLFVTEPFDLPTGAAVEYYRDIAFSDSLALDSGVFADPALHLIYWIELLHPNGHIDTLEKLEHSPGQNLHFANNVVKFQNLGLPLEDLRLRVSASYTGFPDVDSLATFEIEYADSSYSSEFDIQYALNKLGKGLTKTIGERLNVKGPYPNPSRDGEPNSLLISFAKDHDIRMSILNELGQVVWTSTEIISTGNWQKINLPQLSKTGYYIIKVESEGQIQSIPFINVK